MALGPEEMKRRREKREADRKRRAAQKRRLRIRLLIAAVVLIGCGLLIFLLSTKPKAPAKPEQTEPPETAAEQTARETEAGPTTTVRIAFTGDLNVTDRVVAAGGGAYDYTNLFLSVTPILADADLAVVNLEGNLCGSPYGTSTSSAPQQLLDGLKNAGVDMIQLANSYSISNGISGLQSSINAVYAAGMEPLGVYADQASFRASKGFTIREVGGIEIAFVAFTKGMDGMALPESNKDSVNVLYTDYDSTYQKVDTEGITQILENVERASPDITIALLHWGSEYNDTISESQEKILKLMKENGVDVVVGTHPHYVQQMIFDRAAGTFIAYSLGDFCGDAERAGSEYSAIVELEITKERASGTTKVSGWQYYPTFTVNERGHPLRILRLQEGIAAYEERALDRVSQATYEKMLYALQRVEARIKGE